MTVDRVSKHQLAQILFAESKTVCINGVTGTLSSVEKESGCGRSYNVTMYTERGKVTFNVKTID